MTHDLNYLDINNRTRALELASFIVEAPAGAGKTELLTQRYLSLLAWVNEPEEIIALTFTNKAATEMRNRILLSLERAQNNIPETLPHKVDTRKLANKALEQSKIQQWNLLSQPSRLRILTIDALCSSLTRQMPLLSKFGGQPVVSDDTEIHYIDAARRAIADIEHESQPNDPVTLVLGYLDNNSAKLIELLAKMLARRDQWLPLATKIHSVEVEHISKNTTIAIKHLMTESLALASEVLTLEMQNLLMPIVRFAASNLEANSDIAVLLDWQSTLTVDVNEFVKWQALAKFLLTKTDRQFRKKVDYRDGFPADKLHKNKKDDFILILNSLENSNVISALLDYPAIESIEDNQLLIQALTKLLVSASAHLWSVFQASGEVDFVAIAQSAQLALENEQGATDLALKLDYKISHLLIDEFQDTSPVQMHLIEKLIEGWQPNDGRTLFCVGDPMQSIYRFRKAEVSLFLQAAKSGIGHLPLERLQLSQNNRSHPAVVEWINQSFAQVFPAQDNINQGAISYRKFSATLPSIVGEGVFPHALIIDANSDDEAEDGLTSANLRQMEAEYVAKLIVKLRESFSEQRDTKSKIAVLVRSRSHLKELVSEIRRNYSQLKFQAVEIEHLNERQTVQDALSLVCALHHRADRTHWLNVLRAPWCGLKLADLHALAADNHHMTIWQLMQDEVRLQKLSEDGRIRLSHVNTVLAAAFKNQGRMPTRRWVESTWLQLGGGKCLVDVGDNRDVQVFFDLVEKIGRRGYLDIAALELGMKKLYAKPDIEADGSVQFLTIHKSKGLEFDTVILPALNRKPRNEDHELVLWNEVMVDQHLHLIAAPMTTKLTGGTLNKYSELPSVYALLKKLEKERADNEVVRLLYVAATRTKRQLHLVASMQINKTGEIKPVANSLLKALWPAVEVQFTQVVPQGFSASENQSQAINQFIPKLQRLQDFEFSADMLGITDLYKLSDINNSKNEINENPLDFKANLDMSDLYKHSGTLAHIYMELFSKTDLQIWTSQRLAQCKGAMQRWLNLQGHSSQLAINGAEQVLAALNVTLLSEAGRWVLQQHNEAASELNLMHMENASLINQVIDRTFVIEIEGKKVRWIVDYKLTHWEELSNSTIDLTIAAEQHRPQLDRYEKLFLHEKLEIKKAVLFLNYGQLIEL